MIGCLPLRRFPDSGVGSIVLLKLRGFPAFPKESHMTSENQRRTFIKTGCQKAVESLDKNEGKPLSNVQLKTYLDASIEEGLTGRAIAIASLMGFFLNSDQLSRLIDRCLYYESFSDAIYASQQGSIPDETRERLLKACVKNNLAANRKEAEDLLASD